MEYTLADEILALGGATVEINYGFASDDTQVIPALGEEIAIEHPSLRDRFFASRIGRATVAALVTTGLFGMANIAAEAAPVQPAYTTPATPNAPSSDAGKQAIDPYNGLTTYLQLRQPEPVR